MSLNNLLKTGSYSKSKGKRANVFVSDFEIYLSKDLKYICLIVKTASYSKQASPKGREQSVDGQGRQVADVHCLLKTPTSNTLCYLTSLASLTRLTSTTPAVLVLPYRLTAMRQDFVGRLLAAVRPSDVW